MNQLKAILVWVLAIAMIAVIIYSLNKKEVVMIAEPTPQQGPTPTPEPIPFYPNEGKE